MCECMCKEPENQTPAAETYDGFDIHPLYVRFVFNITDNRAEND